MVIIPALVVLTCAGASIAAISGSPVLLVVLDGFREDYLRNMSTPEMNKIWKSMGGVIVPKLIPEFPASRLPFLASLVTGRHTETHQVIGEEAYNIEWNQVLNASQAEFWDIANQLGNLWKSEKSSKVINSWPYVNFWIKSQNQVISRPEVHDSTPSSNETIATTTIKPNFTEADPWQNVVNSTINLLKDGTSKFVSLYLGEPGKTAEMFGPFSNQTVEVVTDIDAKVGSLIKALNSSGLTDKVNVIITSTPGFSSVSPVSLIDLPKGADSTDTNGIYKIYGHSPVLSIKPLPGKDLDVLVTLKKSAQLSKEKFQVFITAELPDEFHFRNAVNVTQPITLVANEGYAFSVDFAKKMADLDLLSNRTQSLTNTYGCSGYNNSLPSMKTFLLAVGPDFGMPATEEAQQKEQPRVVDIYALIVHLLNLDMPKETDSDLNRIRHILRVSNSSSISETIEKVESYLYVMLRPENLPVTISVTAGVILLLISATVCLICGIKRRKKLLKATVGYRYSQVNYAHLENVADTVIS